MTNPSLMLEPSLRSLERDAHRRLQDAREDLASGHVQAGQRQLEVLVHNYPATAAAEEARQELARLYSSEPQATEDARSQRKDQSRRVGNSTARLSEQEGASQRRAPYDLTRAAEIRNTQLAHDLRASAGDRVFFANGSAELGARARQVLAAQAVWLARHPDVSFVIEAHADDAGSAAQNSDLSARRAEAVRDRLVEEGIGPERIQISVFGRERRIATCAGPECSAQNRRVVTSIGGPSQWHQAEPSARKGSFAPRRN